jgi:hypothetical protein
LPCVKDYIEHQKEHHAVENIFTRLEKVSMDDDGSPLENA